MGNFTQWWIQSGLSFPKSKHFFRFSKMAEETPRPLLPRCSSVSVVEYASIFLNMPKYPWKSSNKLFWPCQGSEYAWFCYIFDKLLKMLPLLNKTGFFWIWHGCMSKQGRSQKLKEVPQNFTEVFNIDDITANDVIQRNQHCKEKINLSSIVITDVKS